jgi:hypothetical protein
MLFCAIFGYLQYVNDFSNMAVFDLILIATVTPVRKALIRQFTTANPIVMFFLDDLHVGGTMLQHRLKLFECHHESLSGHLLDEVGIIAGS